MSSNIEPQCDKCGAALGAGVYAPRGTLRGAFIHACKCCSLVQSTYANATPSERRRTLSCDADWGNVRHGKGVRLRPAIERIDRWVKWGAVGSVLDVGANRGDFISWVQERAPAARIVALEPDESVTGTYRSNDHIETIIGRFENVSLAGQFDLIYCSHTLEHMSSAGQCLRKLSTLLRAGGLLFLEVPAVEAIARADVVEEFFIDKHTFHFDRTTLSDWLLESGFKILETSREDELNLTFLLTLADPALPQARMVPAPFGRQMGLIEQYSRTLEENRQVLKSIVKEKLAPLSARQRVAYFGAGRIFDALVKYGGLQPGSVHVLVDTHLAGIVDTTHGLKIGSPAALRSSDSHVCIVLGRSAEDEMARTATRYGIRHVVRFSQLFEQSRIAAAN